MKKNMFFAAGIFAAASFALPQLASASLIYDASIQETGVGFGNAPRDLTLQGETERNSNLESGSVTVTLTGQIDFGSPVSSAQVFDSNGVTNSNLLGSLVSPLGDNQKFGIPTIGSLGITSANQIGVIFNATEEQGDSINLIDLTLKFFSSTGTFLGAIDGSQNFASSFAGNGVAGFTFVVSQDEQAFVNTLLGIGGAGTKLALEASLTNFGGGPESFLIYNLSTGAPNPPSGVPEPTTVALFGLGLLGFAASRRKSAKNNNG